MPFRVCYGKEKKPKGSLCPMAGELSVAQSNVVVFLPGWEICFRERKAVTSRIWDLILSHKRGNEDILWASCLVSSSAKRF